MFVYTCVLHIAYICIYLLYDIDLWQFPSDTCSDVIRKRGRGGGIGRETRRRARASTLVNTQIDEYRCTSTAAAHRKRRIPSWTSGDAFYRQVVVTLSLLIASSVRVPDVPSNRIFVHLERVLRARRLMFHSQFHM